MICAFTALVELFGAKQMFLDFLAYRLSQMEMLKIYMHIIYIHTLDVGVATVRRGGSPDPSCDSSVSNLGENLLTLQHNNSKVYARYAK